MREVHATQLWESCKEVLCQSTEGLAIDIVLRPKPIAAVIDRVKSTPQNSPITRAAVIVELVASIVDSREVVPADVSMLLGSERLGHQDVVIDGRDVVLECPHG